jgi:diguanylate cyclase (GGDEF)-like protein
MGSVAAMLGAAVRREELEARLQHQALHDPLTGLPNRAMVLDRIDRALERSARRGSPLAVMLLDVDDFKVVNDTLGHSRGDELLADLALRLREAVRPCDTVARLGGDEFVVVVEDAGVDVDLVQLVEDVLEACGTTVDIAGRQLTLSASVGVACHEPPRAQPWASAATSTSLLSEADIAMYHAKRDRPGTFRVFDEAMRDDVLDRMSMAVALRAAVRAGEVAVAYQPIVHLQSGRVVAMEALARWTTRAGEVIGPDVFIPVAEETGIIGELGDLVLHEAVEEAVRWQAHAPIGVRVNASPHQLRNPLFSAQVLRTVGRAGLPARLLGIEITESVFVDEDPFTQGYLTALRRAGVSLLIDVGTGYSSPRYLQRLPVVDVLRPAPGPRQG